MMTGATYPTAPAKLALQRRLSQLYGVTVLLLVLSFVFGSSAVNAAIDVYEFDSPSQEAQYKALIEEFRCPKCQNQNLAGSDSQIAQDLKRKTYEMVVAGQSDQQIREYMYERYGDYISYKPPIRPSTWILWFFPPLFLLLVLGWWLWRNARRSHQRRNAVRPAMAQTAVADDIVNDKPSNGEFSNDELDNTVSRDNVVTNNAGTNGIDIPAKSTLSDDEQKMLNELLSKHSVKSPAEDNNTSKPDKK